MPLDSYDFKSGTVDTTIDPETALYFGADSQSDTTPAPQQVQALAAALAIRTETLTNKTIDYIVRGSGNVTVPDGPATLATTDQIIGLTATVIPDFTQSGTGAVTRTWQNKARDIIDVADFGSIGTANDKSVIQTAINALTAGKTLRLHGTLNFNGVVTITTNNVGIWFDDCTINIGDTGTSATLTNSATGKVGFHFKQADQIFVGGRARLIGTGTVGSTTLAGMVFDECDHVICDAALYFENMAAGRFVQWCNHGHFGDITAYRMKGQQTFDVGTAGTAEVVVGCVDSTFGRIASRENYKPIRYLSTGPNGSGTYIDNAYCRFGFVTGTPASGSTESSLIAIRSGVDCYHEGAAGSGFCIGLNIVQYAADIGHHTVDRNTVSFIGGVFPSTGYAGDAAVSQITSSGPTIGSNHVLSVVARCLGEGGVLLSSGSLRIGQAYVYGGTQPVAGLTGDLSIGKLTVGGSTQAAVTIYQGCNFDADFIDVITGSTGGVSGAVRYDNSSGSGGVGSISINRVRYRHNSVGTDFLYAVMDLTNGFESWHISNIDGTGSTSPARFGSDEFSIKRGNIRSTAVPTTGTYSVGTQLWKSNAASGGTPGWVCTTAGTPGTWKAMANLA